MEDAIAFLEGIIALVIGLVGKLADAIQDNIFMTILFATIVFSLGTWAFTKVVRVARSVSGGGGGKRKK